MAIFITPCAVSVGQAGGLPWFAAQSRKATSVTLRARYGIICCAGVEGCVMVKHVTAGATHLKTLFQN